MIQYTNWTNSASSQQWLLSCSTQWLDHSVYNRGIASLSPIIGIIRSIELILTYTKTWLWKFLSGFLLSRGNGSHEFRRWKLNSIKMPKTNRGGGGGGLELCSPRNFLTLGPSNWSKKWISCNKIPWLFKLCRFYGKSRDFQRSTVAGFPGQWTPCTIISKRLITTKGDHIAISFPESSLKLLASLFARYRMHLNTLKLQFRHSVAAVQLSSIQFYFAKALVNLQHVTYNSSSNYI